MGSSSSPASLPRAPPPHRHHPPTCLPQPQTPDSIFSESSIRTIATSASFSKGADGFAVVTKHRTYAFRVPLLGGLAEDQIVRERDAWLVAASFLACAAWGPAFRSRQYGLATVLLVLGAAFALTHALRHPVDADVLRVLCCHGLRFVATEEEAHAPPNRRTRVVGLGVDGNDGSKYAALEPGGQGHAARGGAGLCGSIGTAR